MLTGVERSNELVPNGHASVLTNAIPKKDFKFIKRFIIPLCV